MKQVTLNIPENQFPAFMKFIRTLDFVNVEKPLSLEDELTASQKEVWENIKEGFKEFQMIEQGHSKARPVKFLLDELDS